MSGKTRDERVYLIHIQECLTRITQYTQGGREEFLSDTKTQDAVLRNLQTMAESTQKLSETLKAAHPEIAWKQIAAFRNVIAHDYLGINPDRIWETIASDLPSLEQQITDMLVQKRPSDG